MNNVLFYPEYMRGDLSDAELFEKTALLGNKVSENNESITIQYGPKTYDVEPKYVKSARYSNGFTRLGGRYGSVWIYSIIALLIFLILKCSREEFPTLKF